MPAKPKLLLATTNRGKFGEFSQLLRNDFEILDPLQLKTPPPRVQEGSISYRENCRLKAEAYFSAYQLPTLADDSGLEVSALKNGPGVTSAEYGGEDLSWEQRRQLILTQLSNSSDRSARFRAVLGYIDAKCAVRFFEGVVEGEIGFAPKGSSGFGYDPIFFGPESGSTFGEAELKDKLLVSHRTRATQSFLAWYRSRLLDRP